MTYKIVWQTGWDSNPRNAMNVQRISNPPLSATQPPVLIRFYSKPIQGIRIDCLQLSG